MYRCTPVENHWDRAKRQQLHHHQSLNEWHSRTKEKLDRVKNAKCSRENKVSDQFTDRKKNFYREKNQVNFNLFSLCQSKTNRKGGHRLIDCIVSIALSHALISAFFLFRVFLAELKCLSAFSPFLFFCNLLSDFSAFVACVCVSERKREKIAGK